MDSKLSIFLLLTTLAESSLALDTGSCAAGTTIGASLATIQFAEDTPRIGLARMSQLINTELLTVLAEKSQGSCINSEEAEFRAEQAQNQSFDALFLGIPPTYEAYTILRPELDVYAIINSANTPLQYVNGLFWTGIRTARTAANYSEARTAIANLSESAQATSAAAISTLYDYMLDGTALIPDGAEDVIACVKEQAASELVTAVAVAYEEILILLEAIFNAENQDDVDQYSSEIASAHEKVLEFFDREVIDKVSILRNIVIADYLNKTGIVTGLFNLQAATGNRFI